MGIFFRCCFRDYEIAVRLSRSAIVATGSIFLSKGIKESANESIASVLLTVWVISPFSHADYFTTGAFMQKKHGGRLNLRYSEGNISCRTLPIVERKAALDTQGHMRSPNIEYFTAERPDFSSQYHFKVPGQEDGQREVQKVRCRVQEGVSFWVTVWSVECS